MNKSSLHNDRRENSWMRGSIQKAITKKKQTFLFFWTLKQRQKKSDGPYLQKDKTDSLSFLSPMVSRKLRRTRGVTRKWWVCQIPDPWATHTVRVKIPTQEKVLWVNFPLGRPPLPLPPWGLTLWKPLCSSKHMWEFGSPCSGRLLIDNVFHSEKLLAGIVFPLQAYNGTKRRSERCWGKRRWIELTIADYGWSVTCQVYLAK